MTVSFVLSCGTCPTCTSGDSTVCDHREVIGFTLWGAFAEAIFGPRADFNLVPLPDTLPFDVAAGMGCSVTTAWRALTTRGGLRPGEWLAVHCCGGVGLAAILIAQTLRARVVAVDISEDTLKLARALCADVVANARDGDPGEAAREASGGGARVSLEALGITQTFDVSPRPLRDMGRHAQVGMPVGTRLASAAAAETDLFPPVEPFGDTRHFCARFS